MLPPEPRKPRKAQGIKNCVIRHGQCSDLEETTDDVVRRLWDMPPVSSSHAGQPSDAATEQFGLLVELRSAYAE